MFSIGCSLSSQKSESPDLKSDFSGVPIPINETSKDFVPYTIDDEWDMIIDLEKYNGLPECWIFSDEILRKLGLENVVFSVSSKSFAVSGYYNHCKVKHKEGKLQDVPYSTIRIKKRDALQYKERLVKELNYWEKGYSDAMREGVDISQSPVKRIQLTDEFKHVAYWYTDVRKMEVYISPTWRIDILSNGEDIDLGKDRMIIMFNKFMEVCGKKL